MDDLEQPVSLSDGRESEAGGVESAGEVEHARGADDEPLFADPSYRAAVVDLLGALAYGELTAFSRLAADADMAPNQPAKAALARVAVAEFHHYDMLTIRLSDMGVDPDAAMEPFIAPIDQFHERTKPGSWLEGLVKAYVGDGIATDFYREISAYVDSSTQTLVRSVMEDVGQAEFAVRTVREAIEADPTVGGRLALWGRRLVGEALSQSQRVAVERDALASLLVGGHDRPGADLAELGRMFVRLTDEHTRRMRQLGLNA
jgi:tRNA-(MS[2]IO[6]A)-hydroxylase (MiaE)-like